MRPRPAAASGDDHDGRHLVQVRGQGGSTQVIRVHHTPARRISGKPRRSLPQRHLLPGSRPAPVRPQRRDGRLHSGRGPGRPWSGAWSVIDLSTPEPRKAGWEHGVVTRPDLRTEDRANWVLPTAPETALAGENAPRAGHAVTVRRGVRGGPARRANGARDRMPCRPVSEPGAYDNTDVGSPGECSAPESDFPDRTEWRWQVTSLCTSTTQSPHRASWPPVVGRRRAGFAAVQRWQAAPCRRSGEEGERQGSVARQLPPKEFGQEERGSGRRTAGAPSIFSERTR